MDLKLSLKIISRICLCYFINGFYHQKEKLKHLLSKLKYNKVCYRVSSERQPVGTAPVLPQHQVTWPRYKLVHHHRIIKWKKVKENVPKRPRMGKKKWNKKKTRREKKHCTSKARETKEASSFGYSCVVCCTGVCEGGTRECKCSGNSHNAISSKQVVCCPSFSQGTEASFFKCSNNPILTSLFSSVHVTVSRVWQ